MTAISDTDAWETAPDGPPNGGARSSPLMRSYLGKINNRARWTFNRMAGLFGSFAIVEAVDTGTDRLTITGHGLASNTLVRIASVGGSVPTGTSSIVPMYVIVVDVDTIQVSLSSGPGSAANLTSTGSGTLYLYTVPDALASIMCPAVNVSGGYSITPRTLKAAMAYMVTFLGATFTGKVKFAGPDARVIKRATETIPDSDDTIDVSADVWYQTTPTAQRDHEVLDATGTLPEDGDEVEVRRGAAGNFAIVLHREGSPGAICTLPALTCCSSRLRYTGGVWTLLSYSGAVVPGADAG